MIGPEHYREAERLAARAHHFTYGDGADPVVGAALAAEAQVHATLALTAATVEQASNAAIAADINSLTFDQWYPLTHRPQQKDTPKDESTPADLTVYRASHESIVMGTYTSREVARQHCETLVRREVGDDVPMGWVPDDGSDDAPEELCIGDDVECTGYVVTPLTVDSAYDEEADE